MKNIETTKQQVIFSRIEPESSIRIGRKTYVIKRHYVGKRGIKEALNEVIVNHAEKQINR